MSSSAPSAAGPTARPPSPMAVTVARAADGQAWDAYVATHPLATADHRWAWRTVFESVLGHATAYLVARRGDRVSGVLPLVLFRSRLFGRSVISLPFLNYGGVLADDEEVARALVEAAAGEGRAFSASHVELRHVAPQCPGLPSRQHKLAMTLPLSATTEAQWTAIDRKIRNQVRKAQKEGLTTEAGGEELVGEFYAVFARNMRDLGTPVYPESLFRAALEAFPGQAQLVVVRKGTQPIAGGFTIAFRNTVLNPWASALREFRSLSPNVLLYWTMIDAAITRGATVFDFGRSSPDGGTHQFKEQWGASPAPMHWEYVLLLRQEPPNQGPTNPKFERAINLWKKLPLPVANTIGPFIARHLP